MVRRVWRALGGSEVRRRHREAGGQHVEAGVLIATLMVAGAAVVAAAPAIGQATADFWTCSIRSAASCAGDTRAGTPRRGLAEAGQVADQAGDDPLVDPATYHVPRTVTPEAQRQGGTWSTPGGDVEMVGCDRWTPDRYLCTAPDGVVWDCRSADGNACYDTTIPTYPMPCANEGTSADSRICRTKNGGLYHCTNTDVKDQLSCTSPDNDADAEMPDDAVPVSCGDDNTGEGPAWSVTCMGSNGTLYQCPRTAAYGSDCRGGGRNIDRNDASLTDCVAVPQYGEDAVQCTYTSTDRECPADQAQGCTLPRTSTTVLCHDDPPSKPQGAYQHCQDLGGLVSPQDKREGVCVVEVTPTDCDETSPVTVEGDPPTTDTTVQVGDVQVDIDSDAATASVPDASGQPQDLTYDELVPYCESNPATCDRLIDERATQLQGAADDGLSQLGLCSTVASCEALVLGTGEPGTGRSLLSRNRIRISLVAAGLLVWNWAGNSAIIATATDPNLSRGTKIAVGGLEAAVVYGVTALVTTAALRSRAGGRTPAQQAAQLAGLGAAAATTAITQGPPAGQRFSAPGDLEAALENVLEIAGP